MTSTTGDRDVAHAPINVDIAPEGGKRVHFEMKRPNGDRFRYSMRTSHLNVLFTTGGPIEIVTSLPATVSPDPASATPWKKLADKKFGRRSKRVTKR